jgi:hypothetical protein
VPKFLALRWIQYRGLAQSRHNRLCSKQSVRQRIPVCESAGNVRLKSKLSSASGEAVGAKMGGGYLFYEDLILLPYSINILISCLQLLDMYVSIKPAPSQISSDSGSRCTPNVGRLGVLPLVGVQVVQSSSHNSPTGAVCARPNGACS